jgi:N-acetylglucosamine-6-phosphate deacetylase
MLTPDGFRGPSVVAVDDAGLISSIEPATAPTPDVTLVPGFVDLQVNGLGDIDVAAARGDDWQRISDLLLDQGVTAWCPTIVTNALDRYAAPLGRIAEARRHAGSRIIGAHLEGPFLGGAPGAHPRHLLAPIDLDWLAALPDIVRLVTLAPELPLAVEAIRLLVARGIVVSLGHSTPSPTAVDAAVAAGATMVTHLFNGMSGVHHRQPGLAAGALVEDRLAVGLIADLVHVHPLALRLAFRAKPSDKTVLVTDAVAARSGRRCDVSMPAQLAVEVRDGAPRLADGTLAGSIVTMDQAIRNVVQGCGVTVEQAIRSASTNPARLIGCADRGELAVGRRADLVGLDGALRITGVWLGGVQVRHGPADR